jgi:hypothetical protein
MEQIRTVDGVIEALGGVTKAASALEQRPNAVSNWKLRRRIPPEHFLTVSEVLRTAGKAVAPEVFGMRTSE